MSSTLRPPVDPVGTDFDAPTITPDLASDDGALPAAAQAQVFIVIAAFHEAPAIAAVVHGLRAAGWRHVVVVDDGSEDATSSEAAAAGALVLRHALNRGQGAALQTGIAFALRRGAGVVVTFDADGQHRPEDLPGLIAPILSGEVDVVLGSRFLGHQGAVPWRRRLLLRAARRFQRWTSGLALTDAHNGLRALSRRMALQFNLRMDRMAHASELVDQIAASGLRWREVSVHVVYTDYARAKGQRGWAAARVLRDYLLGRLLG